MVIEVMGGYAKIVDTETTIDGCGIELTVYVRMFYGDETVKDEMVKLLRELGFKTEINRLGIIQDSLYKKMMIVPTEVK